MPFKDRATRKAWRRDYNDQLGSSLRFRVYHGPGIEGWFAAAWEQQDGRCYLCGEPMDPKQAHIDHDHRCCPKNSSCRYCRRGIAHPTCNTLIGLAGDDPDRLHRIAENLRAAMKSAGARLAEKPEQQALG